MQQILLLQKPIWNNTDIMQYVGCKATKASEIKQLALKRYKGVVRGFPQRVKRDAVLELLGLSFEEEIKKLNILEDLTNGRN